MTQTQSPTPPRSAQESPLIQRVFRAVGAISPGLAGWLALQLVFTPLNQPKVTRGQAVLDEAEPMKLLHRGRRLAGYLWNPDGQRTVLLVHGWRAQSGSMSAFVGPLVARGCRVIAFDAPAHAKSQGRQTDIVDYSEAIAAVMGQYGPVYGLIAHSFGAAATAVLLDHQPQWMPEKLVLIAPPARLEDVLRGYGRSMGAHEQVMRAVIAHAERRMQTPIGDFDLVKIVSRYSRGGLIVHDRGDDVVPFAAGAALADSWPAARLLATEGLNHRDVLREPSTVEQVAEYVSTR